MSRHRAKEDGPGELGLRRRIVVGIDGTASSIAALDWAGRQAELTGASIDAVMVWRWPTAGIGIVAFPAGYRPEVDASEVLATVVAGACADHPAVEVRTSVVEGEPGSELVRAAQNADLLVLGSRGHGEIAGVLLGSVGQHCATHARCPVVIVHEGDTERKEAGGNLPAAVAASPRRL